MCYIKMSLVVDSGSVKFITTRSSRLNIGFPRSLPEEASGCTSAKNNE